MKQSRRVIAVQAVSEELMDTIKTFMAAHRRIPSISEFAKVAIEEYIDLASKYGIDSDWKIKVPQGEKGRT